MLRYLVLGAGLVGEELARQLRARGDRTIGTTTTPAKVERLSTVFDEVRVLRGSDEELLTAALSADVDAVVVCAGPRAAFTEEERERAYRAALVDTAESVVRSVRAAGMTGPVVALSSTSVYGSAQNDREVVEEDGPLTGSEAASPRNFQLMERTYLEGLPGQACVLRCTEVYGDEEQPIEETLRAAHKHTGGTLPFAGDALLYRTHATDVAAAARHAVSNGLSGVFNLAHPEVPLTNAERFDAVSASIGLPPFTYQGAIEAPTRPLSVEKLARTGFTTLSSPPVV